MRFKEDLSKWAYPHKPSRGRWPDDSLHCHRSDPDRQRFISFLGIPCGHPPLIDSNDIASDAEAKVVFHHSCASKKTTKWAFIHAPEGAIAALSPK